MRLWALDGLRTLLWLKSGEKRDHEETPLLAEAIDLLLAKKAKNRIRTGEAT